jgi:hypothetical protein
LPEFLDDEEEEQALTPMAAAIVAAVTATILRVRTRDVVMRAYFQVSRSNPVFRSF